MISLLRARWKVLAPVSLSILIAIPMLVAQTARDPGDGRIEYPSRPDQILGRQTEGGEESLRNLQTNEVFSGPPALPSQKARRGFAYYTRNCTICHHYDAQGDGPMHTSTLPQPANLTAIRDAPDMLQSIIRRGIPGTAMPAHPMSVMSPTDYDNVVIYFMAQPLDTAGERQWTWPWQLKDLTPEPSLAPVLYATTCAGCHGPAGGGDGYWGADPHVWPKPANFHARNSDLGRLYWIITNGLPGTMMAPQEAKLQTELQRWALARYVYSMYDPASPATMRVGPMLVYRSQRSRFDMDAVERGHTTFQLYCAPCHGGEANGTFLAPQLTDLKWRYGGGTDNAVFTVITKGIPGKLMPAHSSFSEGRRWDVISYLRHRGGMPDPVAQTWNAAKATNSDHEFHVKIDGLRFIPPIAVIEPGTTVVWTNQDTAAHTSTDNSWRGNLASGWQPFSWNSGVLNPGQKFARKFDHPGVSMYYCMVHPYMKGAIAVNPARTIWNPPRD